MAWFGDRLSGLSNLTGQITSFTKEVLTEGIVEETDERTKELNAANERCVQLQEVLNSKDAEISLLRRQNCELQKAVVELNARPREPHAANTLDDDGGGGFFWDPPPVKNREGSKNSERSSILHERLSQATLRIRELEDELKTYTINENERKDELNDDNRKIELLRAKQDMVNRIIQISEKNRDAERNLKRLPLDESILVNDFRAAISKLDSHEQLRMIKSALKALDDRKEDSTCDDVIEKFDVDEKSEILARPRLESISLVSHSEETDIPNGIAKNDDSTTNREIARLHETIREVRKENEFLTTNLDELDKEHAQSLDAILVIKDQLSKKHESLQKAYEQLYVECNEAQTKLQLLESKSSNVSSVEANNNRILEKPPNSQPIGIFNEEKQVQTEASSNETSVAIVQTVGIERDDKDVQTELEVKNGEESDENRKSKIIQTYLSDLTQRINEILKNCPVEADENETTFETLARRYIEANWKKEMLERKLTETARELKQTGEMRDSLQMECDDMQGNIESLLVQIEHLKSNLPSIPEASEERVASLETETESMSEEIKRLKNEHEMLKVKHFELITSVSLLEGSLRNQENLEAEVRNTKQQLDIAKQQLDGASRNVENNENMMEDLSRRLNSLLEENNELRRKIDALEIVEKRAQEEVVRSSDERSKNSEEDAETIARLNGELEIVTRESHDSRSWAELLEKDLARVNEAKNELERDITVISEEKERLEAELWVLRENASEKDTSDLMQNLRDQLDSAKRDKDDLEYDILNMRKELDKALEQLAMTHSDLARLTFDNETLGKENDELLDQLNSTHDDMTERIELLQTEMNLLSQEHSALKEESINDKAKLVTVEAKLSESETQRTYVENELSATISKLESSKLDYREVEKQAEKIVALEERVKLVTSLEDQLHEARTKCKLLETELTKLREGEEELKSLRETCESLKERCTDATTTAMKFVETENRCRELETLIASLQAEISNHQVSKENEKATIVELTTSRTNLESSLEKAKENATMAKETIESLSRLVKEKDIEIERLKTAEIASAEKKHSEDETALATLKAEREEFVRLVQEKHNTSLQYYAEIQRLAQLLSEQGTTLQQVIAEGEERTVKLKEKEAEVLWVQNELRVVRQRLNSLEESQNYGQTCGIVEHSVQIAQTTILNEKCKALEAALIMEQSNNRIIQNQLTESQSREANAAKELERLRTHLVEMEASYTEEALIAEENRKQLEAKLLHAEEKVQSSSTNYTSASIRANQQVETLQQQMALIIQQRDEIQSKLSAAEDKVLSHTASLTNLQIVLEQFQRDKENDIRTATEKIRQQLNMSYKEQEDLRNEIVNLRTQLSEAKECLQAASRLSEQLDKKSERIEELNREVAKLTELVNTADQRIQEAMSNEEGKVDKNLVKNLLLGFLNSSTMDKSSVLRVFATVLEFDESEREKIGLNHPAANSGWFSGLLGSGGVASTKDQEASLSAAFVRFLESESKPKPQLPALTISNSSLARPGHSRQHSSSSTQSGLLLSSITLPTFPDFVPSRNTGSILKEVLKDS